MTEQVKSSAKEYKYKAEMKQLLNLIVHSLYTNPDVFLRELVSNASDALNKIRFIKLTNSNIFDPDAELCIKIDFDKDQGTFSIEDTGIGMSKEELVSQLGTVASSGTMNFIKNLGENKGQLDANLIGQFGVGFYSVFMVTDEVTVETKNSSLNSKAYIWKSSGQDSYTIEESEKSTRGTKISFKLKDDYKDLADDYKIKNILKKYSNFVDFPLYVKDEKVNIVNALWHRKKEDISDDELKEFYKFITNDFSEPLGHLHLSIEGVVNFKSLLFIPESAPANLFQDIQDKTLHLYSSKVFIQDDSKNLLPEYLKFVKGVIDTEDLPLNVSREVTQNSPVMSKIRDTLTSKILGLLEEWALDNVPKYDKFFKSFGPLFKTGINSDFKYKDRITELLRYESSILEKGKQTSLKEYVTRMKEDQKEIFYLTSESRDSAERNPNLEYFKKNNIEVLLLTDPSDMFTFPYIFNYDGKELKSIDKADIDLKKDEGGNESDLVALISKFKEVLGDNIEDVVTSGRLVESPVTLVVGKEGMDPQMEKIMKIMDKEYSGSKRILEINPNHNLIVNLNKMLISDAGNPMLTDSVQQLYDGAVLMEGYLQSPSDFLRRMHEIMIKATDTN